jgi:hypothetical protein
MFPSKSEKKKEQRKARRKGDKTKPPLFPPAPPSRKLKETVIQGWCEDTLLERFVEGGCVVCGQLTPVHQLSDLLTGYDLNILNRDGMGLTVVKGLPQNKPSKKSKACSG